MKAMRIAMRLLLVLALLFASLVPASGTSAAAPTITTDQADYSPGGTVNFTGSGFWPGETVDVVATGREHGSRVAVQSTADEVGSIGGSFQLPLLHEPLYDLTATGQSSGLVASTTFTDTFSGSVSISPRNVTLGPGATQVFTITTKDQVNGVWVPAQACIKMYTNEGTFSDTKFTTNSVTGVATVTYTAPTSGAVLNDAVTAVALVGGMFSPCFSLLWGEAEATRDGTGINLIYDTTLSVDPATGIYTGTTSLSATLKTTPYVSALGGKTIRFTLNGVNVGTAVTDSSGRATLNEVRLGDIDVGTYANYVGASYAGEAHYRASNGSNSLTVTPPPIFEVTSENVGAYTVGNYIDILVKFQDPVSVTGYPKLLLATGRNDAAATYIRGAGSGVLTFSYWVQDGDNSADLDYLSTTALDLNGGTITNSYGGAPTVLTLPPPGVANWPYGTSLGVNKDIVVGTAPPVITILEVTGSGGEDTAAPFSVFTNSAPTIRWKAEWDRTDGVNQGGRYLIGFNGCVGGFTGINLEGDYQNGTIVTSTIDLASPVITYGDHDIYVCVRRWVGTDYVQGSTMLNINVDKYSPVASPFVSAGTAGLDGWYLTDATVTWNWVDPPYWWGSGIDSSQCTLSSTSSSEGSNVQLTATCKDRATNQGSATYTVKVDKTAPTVTMLSAPETGAPPVFTFSGNDPGTDRSGVSGFECSLDSGAFTPCESGVNYLGIAAGPHTFYVRAADTAGNTGSALSHTWTVNPPPSISSLSPSSLVAGSAGFDLIISGSSFDPTSTTVRWYDPVTKTTTELTPSSRSETQLTVGIDAGLIATDKTVEVSVTNPDGVSTAWPIFVTAQAASVGTPVIATSTDPEGSASATFGEATATAYGAGTIILTQFEDNPTTEATFTTSGGAGYFDVYIAQDSDFRGAEIKVCDPSFNSSDILYWWDPTANSGAGAWMPVSPVAKFDSLNGCLTFIAYPTSPYPGSPVSSPTLEQLTGTIFVVASPDSTPPTVSGIAWTGSIPTNATSVQYTVTFSESVTGVDTTDFTLTIDGVFGASITSVTGTDSSYTVTVGTGSGDGTLGLNLVDDDTIADAAGNKLGGTGTTGDADGSFTGQTYTIDKTAPTVTINQAAGQADPTSTCPINFTVVFSEPVTGFGDAAADVTLNGTAGADTAIVTEISPYDDTAYNVAVSGMTTSGTVIASIGAGVAADAAGNLNAASTSTDNTVTYNLPAAPIITSADSAMFTVGTADTFTVTATGYPTPTLSLDSGTLPEGVTFTSSTGVLSGTPAAGTAGTYALVFRAANGVSPDATQNLTLTVNPANVAPYTPSNPSPADAATGVAVNTILSWTGGDPDAGDTVTYQVKFGTASTPADVLAGCDGITATTCDPSGDLAYSTPYYWQVVATDNHGLTTSGPVWSFTTAAAPPANTAPVVDAGPDATVTIGGTFSRTVSFSDPDADTWTATVDWGDNSAPENPAVNQEDKTVAISHLYATAGAYTVTVTVTDKDGASGSDTVLVTVNEATAAPVITLHPVSQTVAAGETVSLTAAASGNPAPSVQWQRSTDGGKKWRDVPRETSTTLTLSQVTLEMSGHQYRAVFTNTQGTATSSAATLTMTAADPTIVLYPEVLPGGQVGVAYSQTITASGGTSPYTFAVTGGALPGGLSLSEDGVLSGTPTAAATFTFTVTATDAWESKGSRAYSVTISKTPANSADLVVTVKDSPDPVKAGSDVTYIIAVSNKGPHVAENVVLTVPLPEGTSMRSLKQPNDWTECTPVEVEGVGTMICAKSSMAVKEIATFELALTVDKATVPVGTVLSLTASVGSDTPDPKPGDNSATATTLVVADVPKPGKPK